MTKAVNSSQQNADPDVDVDKLHPEMFDDSQFIVDVDGDSDIDGYEDFFGDDVNLVDVQAPQRRKRVRKRTSDLIDAISVEPDTNQTFAADADSQPAIEDDETLPFIETAVKAADVRKGEDIVAIRVSKITHVTSFVVAVTGNNPPQLRAIANLIEEDLSKQHGLEPRRTDGVPASGWLLLDYGDFFVNVFSREQRNNYNLEGLWRRGEKVDVSDWLITEDNRNEPVLPNEPLDDWLTESS